MADAKFNEIGDDRTALAASGDERQWRDQRRRKEARELLAPISEWFTEGFEAPDLTESKALLIPQDRRPC